MSASSELHIEHVIEGNLSLPKKMLFSCIAHVLANAYFSRLVFCASVIRELYQKLLDSSLSMYGFVVYLLMLGNWFVMIAMFFSWSCLVRYVCRHLTCPLSGCLR